MIPITPQLAVEDREVTLDFVRASGPGGQIVELNPGPAITAQAA